MTIGGVTWIICFIWYKRSNWSYNYYESNGCNDHNSWNGINCCNFHNKSNENNVCTGGESNNIYIYDNDNQCHDYNGLNAVTSFICFISYNGTNAFMAIIDLMVLITAIAKWK